MSRTQLAGSFLLASAFVLGGLLLNRLGGPPAPAAYADQVIQAGSYTFMTARTASDDESLFVVDNFTERLVIIDTDVNKRRIEVLATLDLATERGRGRSR